MSNLNLLIPRMYDLLHKAQRTIHLNTLETLVAMVSRYPQQFTQQASGIMKEIQVFVTDADLQAASLALRLSTHIIQLDAQSQEIQNLISRAALLSKSPLIQGYSLSELLEFFSTASRINQIKDQTIGELLDYVSLKSQQSAAALA